MRMFCYYYDEAKQAYFETSYWAMKEIEGTTEFLRRKSKLYKNNQGKTRMQIVVKGSHQGFRRYPMGTGNLRVCREVIMKVCRIREIKRRLLHWIK